MLIIRILNTATRVKFMLTELSNGPLCHLMSINPIISKFTRLLPNASPAARSGAPTAVTELIPVANSGSDVAEASNNTPTKVLPRPVLNAITSADFAKNPETARIIMVAIMNCSQTRYILNIYSKQKLAVPPKDYTLHHVVNGND